MNVKGISFYKDLKGNLEIQQAKLTNKTESARSRKVIYNVETKDEILKSIQKKNCTLQ